MSGRSFTASMKATMGLVLSFLIFLVVTAVATLLLGPWDIYILVSLVIFVPLLIVLFVFAWRGKPWAYIGTGGVGAFVVVATPASLPSEMPPLLMWVTVLATVLGVLMALEGYKAYTELKQPKP